MNRKRIVTLLVVGIASAAFVSSCSKRPKYKGKIGVTCMDLTNPFFKLIAYRIVIIKIMIWFQGINFTV